MKKFTLEFFLLLLMAQFVGIDLQAQCSMACNDNVQVSVAPTDPATPGLCEAAINIDMMMEGANDAFLFGVPGPCMGDQALIEVKDGSSLVASGNVTDVNQQITFDGSAHLGSTLVTKITLLNASGSAINACWGSIVVEDKSGPALTCPVGPGPNGEFIVDCTVDLTDTDLVPEPTIGDNCDPNPSFFLVNETSTGGPCGTITLTRNYSGVDAQGNASINTCDVLIQINPIGVSFPADITWECEQYGDWPNITDPLPVNDLIDVANACLETNRNRRLQETGSGVPNVYELNNEVCRFNITSSDQILEACQGAGTSSTLKILRNWTVLNWCTGAVTNHTQIIKVADKVAPVIDLTNYDATFTVNEVIGSAPHNDCKFSGLIPVPTHFDECSGIKTIRLQVWSAAKGFFTSGIPVTNSAGDIMGWNIPAPYLDKGDLQSFYFTAIDNCGNEVTEIASALIKDDVPPVPICRELTQVSLTNYQDGISEVLADYFDEGSYDNCGPVFFKVRKMELGTCDDANIDKPEEVNYERGVFCNISDPQEWFDDDVKFCCEEVGSTVNVVLRVYDRRVDCDDLGWVAVPTLANAAGIHFDPPCYPTCDLGGTTFEGLSERGLYNDCMIEVLVEDKARPDCKAPADLWLTCADVPENIDWSDYAALDGLYGAASAIDNCDATIETISVANNLDNCGVGTVTRNFRATDINGNSSNGACRQVIMVQEINNYCITLPADFEGECNNVHNPNELTFVELGCDLLAITKELDEYFAGGPSGECKKEIFTWRVINWCEYDGVSAATELPRADFVPPVSRRDWLDTDREFCSDGTNLTSVDPLVALPDVHLVYPSTGYYTYKQHVKIFDNTAPEVSYDGDVEFCGGELDEDPCTGLVDISLDVTEECTDALTSRWELSAFSDSFAAADFTGGGSALFGRYPLGTHTVRFYVSDDCGNTSFYDVTFTIIDCKAPTPVCFNGLSVELMPTGMVSVWASDFDASSFDYCHEFELTANVVTDRIRDGIINSADYLTTRPTTTEVLLDCNHVGTTTFIQLWVHELSGDNVNDDDYCIAIIEVQDNMNACAASRTRIAGLLEDEKGENIQDVEVSINGGMNANMMTTNNGQYSFDVAEGGDYSIVPMKNDDVRNGVSTFDLAMISKHVLNVQKLNSPYKMIAADANNSGSISTLDLVAIRKVILFVSNDFPNNTSWRFIDREFTFSNAQNPFADVFPEVKNFNNVNGINAANFIGVKIGDVSGDAAAHDLGSIEDRTFNGTFNLNAKNIAFNAGDVLNVPITANLSSIEGYQATLNFNSDALELVDIELAELTKENFGTTMTDEGIVTMSWNGNADTDNAFTLIFTAKTDGTLDNELSISSLYTAAEAYTNSDLMEVDLVFQGSTSEANFSLYQNTPNPFKSETVIGFELPKSDIATLTVSDISGKVLRVVKGQYDAGYNSITLEMSSELPAGVLIYELKTSTDKATQKMTVVK